MPNPLASLPGRHYDTGCGIYSICSAHPMSIRAGVKRALLDDTPMLLEATSNQVDQYGGYTGMTPQRFREWVKEQVGRLGLPADRLILGGDHLGPNPWRKEPAAQAMEKARELVRQYAAAGFTKIHLDCSMALGGDDGPAPSQEVVASRAADLCRVAEDAASGPVKPVYVIGTEVPIPGGVTHDVEADLCATRVADADETMETHRSVFRKAGLEDAWTRVIALVVQPGVEFGNYTVANYERSKAAELSGYIAKNGAKNGGLVFEAHSTDYQPERCLHDLVTDHFAILKIGPWLTWAYREALFGLDQIALELGCGVGLRAIIDDVMVRNPANWQGHYHGSEDEVRFARAFSYSDRIRYYLPDQRIQCAVDALIRNLESREIPLPLLSQFLPVQYGQVRDGHIANAPGELLLSAVFDVLSIFSRATRSGKA